MAERINAVKTSFLARVPSVFWDRSFRRWASAVLCW